MFLEKLNLFLRNNFDLTITSNSANCCLIDNIYMILTGDFLFEMPDDISHALLACDVYARSRREISFKG